MNRHSSLFALLAVLVMAACGGPGAGTASYIKGSGKLLREWDEGGAHFFVIHSADKLVRKWRQLGGKAEVRAEVDTATNVCKVEEKVTDCAALASDADLAPFIKPSAPSAVPSSVPAPAASSVPAPAASSVPAPASSH